MYLLQLRQIVEIFARLFESRVKASTLSIHEVEGGFMLSLSDIAATIPMHLCEDLVMRSPVDEIKNSCSSRPQDCRSSQSSHGSFDSG